MNIAEQVRQLKTDFDEVKNAGYEVGMDAFWNQIQPEGNESYKTGSGYFNGRIFCDNNFYPKRDIVPVGDASYLFYGWEKKKQLVVMNLKQRLIDCGVRLDTSKATNLSWMFGYSAYINNIPTIDFTGLTTQASNVFAHTWAGCSIIEKLIVTESTTYSTWFLNATGLTTISFADADGNTENVIGQSIDFQYSTQLSKESIKKIVKALSGNASGKTLTLTRTAVINAFGSTTADEWTALIAPKIAPNGGWTITLV